VETAMAKTELFTSELLRIEVKDEDHSINIEWKGKSVTRQPGQFITPILVDALKKGDNHEKPVILDFRELEYMNSSTITPIIKILERARKGTRHITVLYDKQQKWQDLSFSALGIFETKDNRVRIQGIE
jgi:hypothetical protein